MEEKLAPLAIGAVVGWIVFYFIRKYDRFTSKALLGTVGALIGGEVLTMLLAMLQQFHENNFHLWFFIGVACGFFALGIYVLLLAILYNRGIISDEDKFEKFSVGAPWGKRSNAGSSGMELNESQARILSLIRKMPGLQAKDIALELDMPVNSVNKNINILVSRSWIERRGGKRSGGYFDVEEEEVEIKKEETSKTK